MVRTRVTSGSCVHGSRCHILYSDMTEVAAERTAAGLDANTVWENPQKFEQALAAHSACLWPERQS